MIIKDLENFEYLRNRQNNAKLKGVGAVFVMRLNRQGMKEVSGGWRKSMSGWSVTYTDAYTFVKSC